MNRMSDKEETLERVKDDLYELYDFVKSMITLYNGAANTINFGNCLEEIKYQAGCIIDIIKGEEEEE